MGQQVITFFFFDIVKFRLSRRVFRSLDSLILILPTFQRNKDELE